MVSFAVKSTGNISHNGVKTIVGNLQVKSPHWERWYQACLKKWHLFTITKALAVSADELGN